MPHRLQRSDEFDPVEFTCELPQCTAAVKAERVRGAKCIKGVRPDVRLKRVLQREVRTRARPLSSLPEFLGTSTQRFLWEAHMASRIRGSTRAIALVTIATGHRYVCLFREVLSGA